MKVPATVSEAWAPGRVELLGNHTDYNAGRVLAAAIQFGVGARAERTTGPTPQLVLESEAAPAGAVRVLLNKDSRRIRLTPRTAPTETWANYPLGVAHFFFRENRLVSPFADGNGSGLFLKFRSDLPAGAGLSSSAALEVATCLALEKIFAHPLEPMARAKLCQRAENEFVGVPSGLLDQATSVFGKRGHAVLLDFRRETVKTVPLPPGLGLLVFHTGIPHRLVGGEYGERRERCFAAARALGVRALRDVSSAMLEAAHGRLDEITWQRAAHVVGENERVLLGVAALRRGDGAAFGALMFASHASSRDRFANSTPELDALVAVAREIPGVLGSRLTGGGFGGATVSLIESARKDRIAARLATGYERRTGQRGQAYFCEPADGAA